MQEKREAADHEIETVYLQGLSNDLILTNPTELSKLMLAKLEWLNRSLTSTDENSVSRFRDAALECRQMFNDCEFPNVQPSADRFLADCSSLQVHPTGDPSEALARFCLSIEQRRIRDKDEVRRQWEPLMKKHGNEAQFWLEYVHSERYDTARVSFCPT